MPMDEEASINFALPSRVKPDEIIFLRKIKNLVMILLVMVLIIATPYFM